jgi:hypothetical protein
MHGAPVRFIRFEMIWRRAIFYYDYYDYGTTTTNGRNNDKKRMCRAKSICFLDLFLSPISVELEDKSDFVL